MNTVAAESSCESDTVAEKIAQLQEISKSKKCMDASASGVAVFIGGLLSH